MKKVYDRVVKRICDFCLSLMAIIFLSPLFLVLAIIIKSTSAGPVFFKQKRIGRYKTYFNVLKFRTMRTDAPKDCPTHLLSDPDQYITKVGRFMRKTSIDELPQLFNILIGEMSVVGPRPALWNQDDLVAERDKYGANDVRPGLTGLAQISGRDELEIPIKAAFDGEYIVKMGPFYDLGIIFKTAFKVLRHEGVQEGTHDVQPASATEIAEVGVAADKEECCDD